MRAVWRTCTLRRMALSFIGKACSLPASLGVSKAVSQCKIKGVFDQTVSGVAFLNIAPMTHVDRCHGCILFLLRRAFLMGTLLSGQCSVQLTNF